MGFVTHESFLATKYFQTTVCFLGMHYADNFIFVIVHLCTKMIMIEIKCNLKEQLQYKSFIIMHQNCEVTAGAKKAVVSKRLIEVHIWLVVNMIWAS